MFSPSSRLKKITGPPGTLLDCVCQTVFPSWMNSSDVIHSFAMPAFGLKLSQVYNDALAAACQKYPTRFVGLDNYAALGEDPISDCDGRSFAQRELGPFRIAVMSPDIRTTVATEQHGRFGFVEDDSLPRAAFLYLRSKEYGMRLLARRPALVSALRSGTPDEVRNNPEVISAYLGTGH